MFLEDSAAGLDCIDDAVGKAARFHCAEESIDDFVPDCVRRERVSTAIGQDFRVALANGNEASRRCDAFPARRCGRRIRDAPVGAHAYASLRPVRAASEEASSRAQAPAQ